MQCLQTIFEFAIGVLISAGALHLAALAAGLANRGFSAAISCTLAFYLASAFIYLPVALLVGCFFPWWIFVIFVVLFSIYIIQSIYSTSFGRAFFMWFVMCISYVIVALLLKGGPIMGLINGNGGGSGGV